MTRAVHAWSLHRTLGGFVADHANPPGGGHLVPTGPRDGLALLDLPAELAARGYDTVQLCHFHLPTRDPAYLGELRSALTDAGITLDAFLVDAGDLTHPHDADAHEGWVAGWFDVAAALDAVRVRVIAGQQPPTEENLDAGAARLARLAGGSPVPLVTENWMALLPSAHEVHRVLDGTDGAVGLLVDLGNWTGPDKYDELASVGGRAETCHAKCHTLPDGTLDTDDYIRSLRAVLDAGFTGPLAMVYEGPDDPWDGLAAMRTVVQDVPGAVLV